MNIKKPICALLFLIFTSIACADLESDKKTQQPPTSPSEEIPADKATPTISQPIPLPSVVPIGGISDPGVVLNPAVLPLQEVGTPFIEPVFGTTLRRVSDLSARGGFETQSYSQLQAFSSDNQYMLLESPNGFLVRRVNDFSLIASLDTSGWNNPRWHPISPHTIVHFDTNENMIVELQFTDIDSLVTTTVYTFPSEYQYIRVPQSFDELSDDGRWLGGLLTREDGIAVIFALDIVNQRLGAQLPVPELYAGDCLPDPEWGELEPDWIGVSPLGRYLVVQWVRDWAPNTPTPRCSGLETFDLSSGDFVGRVSPHHAHGDLGIDVDRVSEFFMTVELSSPQDTNRPAIAMRLLPGMDTVSPPIYLQVVDWTDVGHISCRGPIGVCLVSWGLFDETFDFPFENEIFLQYTDGSVLRVAHHRSSKCGYWVQPRASISRNGRYVIFASDWGEVTRTNSCGSRNELGLPDPYIIDLSAIDNKP